MKAYYYKSLVEAGRSIQGELLIQEGTLIEVVRYIIIVVLNHPTFHEAGHVVLKHL